MGIRAERMTRMATIEIKMLGGFEIRVNGKPVLAQLAQSRKATALVQYLVLRRGERVSHKVLTDTLWAGERSTNPDMALRAILHRFRLMIDAEGLDEMKDCIREIEALEDTLCEMYATRMGKDKEEIRAMYFDGKDHWLRADEALALGLIDGIYDADPVPEDSTPEQVFQIFNNRLHKPQNENSMNLDELKRRPRFKNCATDDDFLREIGLLETEAGKVPALDAEVTRLKGELKVFQDKADADDAAARKKLLDDAEQDGRIDAATRPIYENLLAKDRENGEKALEKLSPKRSVMTDLRVNPTGESPWNKRMSEIKDKLNHK